MESEEWYHTDGENSFGPFSQERLRELHAAGTLTDDTLICPGGSEEWLPYSERFADARSGDEETRPAPQEPLPDEHLPPAGDVSRPARKKTPARGVYVIIASAVVAVAIAVGGVIALRRAASRVFSPKGSASTQNEQPSASRAAEHDGPTVKGLFLGMSADDVAGAVAKHMDSDVYIEDATPAENKIKTSKDREIILIKMRSKPGVRAGEIHFRSDTRKVDVITFFPRLSNLLFNSAYMQPREFAQTFIDSYGVPRMSPLQKQTSAFWVYNAPSGWTLAIRNDKNVELYATPKTSFGD